MNYHLKYYCLLFLMTLIVTGAGTAQTASGTAPPDTSAYLPGEEDYNLLVAADLGYKSEVLRLLNAGADINTKSADGVTALMYAAQAGHREVVEMLLLNGADPSPVPDNGINALMGAVMNGELGIAESLLRHGAGVNSTGTGQRSALATAVQLGDVEMTDLLLYYGADPGKADTEGTTPLMLASIMGYDVLAGMLLDEGVSTEAVDYKGFTALQLAAQDGDTALIRLLLDAGADIHHRNHSGGTALALAIRNGNTAAVKLLLARGATPVETYSGGLTGMNLARQYGYPEITALLRQSGGETGFRPLFSTAIIGVGAGGNFTEALTGFSAEIRELNTGIRLGTGFALRPWPRRVLIHAEDDLYWQFWEKRRYAWLSVYLDLARRDPALASPFLGFKTLYTWGSYRGTDIPPHSGVHLAPVAGLRVGSAPLFFSLYYEYLNLKINRVAASRIMFEMQVHINLYGKSVQNRSYSW